MRPGSGSGPAAQSNLDYQADLGTLMGFISPCLIGQSAMLLKNSKEKPRDLHHGASKSLRVALMIILLPGLIILVF